MVDMVAVMKKRISILLVVVRKNDGVKVFPENGLSDEKEEVDGKKELLLDNDGKEEGEDKTVDDKKKKEDRLREIDY